MSETDERLAELCEEVWLQLRDLDPAEILEVLLVLAANVIAENDTPLPCLDYACEVLAAFVHDFAKAEKPRRPILRLVPREPA